MYIIFLILIPINSIFTQNIFTEYLIFNEDTVDIFSYQKPNHYNENINVPLLVAFHEWGGNHNSNFYTNFDEEANQRGWFFLSPYGGSANNYSHQEAQVFFEQEIIWMINNFPIDQRRIYMVGGSMGGAAGAIYANNHLNPNKPMVAATASGSGILDCERRFYEMDGNNSMIQWFGGSPIEVPFEYHRNSAVFFNDLSQSMHINLQYTPIYLDFGSTEAHRYHAEDIYDLLLDYNNNMWIELQPNPGHGYSTMDEYHTCNWLQQFELIDDPLKINVNLDEPSRAYWIEALNQNSIEDFIHINCEKDSNNNIIINEFSNSDTLLLFLINDTIPSHIQIHNNQNNNINLGITGNETIVSMINEVEIVENENSNFENYNLYNNIIFLNIDIGNYTISFNEVFFYDINQDGLWDILDITILISFVLEMINPNELEFEFSDLNNDEQLNIYDIILIINLFYY